MNDDDGDGGDTTDLSVIMEDVAMSTTDEEEPQDSNGEIELATADTSSSHGMSGSSLPLPEELITAQQLAESSSSSRGSSNRRQLRGTRVWYTCGMVGFLIVLLACIIAVAVRNSNDAAGALSSASAVPRQATLTTVLQYLKQHGAVDDLAPNVLDQSSQLLAALWLANTDGANLPVPSAYDYPYIVRYVLAVFYFHLHHDQSLEHWMHEYNWMTSSDVCFWQYQMVVPRGVENVGVQCDPTTDEGPPLELLWDRNILHGSLPTELGLLAPSLTRLELGSNFVEGSLPTELCELTKLEVLILGENALTGTLPPCLAELQQLTTLAVHSNLLGGSIPTQLEELRRLKNFAVENNRLTGNPLRVLEALTDLEKVYADRNEFTGALHDEFLVGHHKLQELDLSTNNFTLANNSHFPLHLLQMQKLERLDLSRNLLDGHLLSSEDETNTTALARNEKLKFLSLFENKLNGGLPSQLEQLVALEHLDVSNNKFHGPLRKEFGKLTNLTYLFLSNNNFQAGSIPVEFQALLPNLVDFSVRNTNRNGPLPAWIGQTDNKLVLLDLGSNDFNHTIPSEYSNLSNLQFLLLNGNDQVTGPVPTFLGDIASLTALFIDGTHLTSNSVEFLCDGAGELVYADCFDDVTDDIPPEIPRCSCCECCYRGDVTGCSDPYLANLDASLEASFERNGDYVLFDPNDDR